MGKNAPKTFTLLASLLLLAACQSTPTKEERAAAEPGPCISPRQAAEIVVQLEQMVIENNPQGPKSSTNLQESGCYKQVYTHGKFRFVIFRPSISDPSSTKGTITPMDASANPESAQDCLSNAIDFLDKIKAKNSKRIVETYKSSYAMNWEDPDLSPVRWLQCKKSGKEYFSGVVTFVHEMVHDLRVESCLSTVDTDNEQTCFHLDPKLPRRSVAKMSAFPTKDSDYLKALQTAQKVYLADTEQSPLMLFDELNAYTTTTEVMTQILKNEGESAVFAKDGTRSAVYLPLFLVYVTRYVDILKRDYPKQFKNDFVKKEVNRKALAVLFQRAEKVYEEWSQLAISTRRPPFSFEDALYKQYKKNKRGLKLPGI